MYGKELMSKTMEVIETIKVHGPIVENDRLLAWDQDVWRINVESGEEVTLVDEYAKECLANQVASTQATCGTAMCFAGWSTYLAGMAPAPGVNVWLSFTEHARDPRLIESGDLVSAFYVRVLPKDLRPPTDTYRTAEGHYVSVPIPSAARSLLGLHFRQSDLLFATHNDVADLRRMVDGLAE